MKILVEVSDHIGIKAAHWATRAALKKMFANAKEAMEVTMDEMETYDEVFSSHNASFPDVMRINGKPVRLYAVKEDK